MIDRIGILHSPAGLEAGWAPGQPFPSPERREGWHVNITATVLAQRPDLQAWRVQPQPETLMRVWAGDDPAAPGLTVALRFADEGEARTALGSLWPEEG